MPDPSSLIGEILLSPWLLPLLALAVVADDPFPFLPSEPLLFSAVATAPDVARIGALFVAALLGSVLGDLLLFGAGRSSNQLIRTEPRDEGLAAWVRGQLHRRPVVAPAAVRLIPGGRLTSVTAAGRVRLPVAKVLVATLVSSLLWAGYMTGVGLLIGPITGGDPVLSLLAGLASATIVTGILAGVRRVRRARPAPTPRPRAGSGR